MGLKKVIRSLIFGKRASSEKYIAYLKNIGVQVGEDVTIYVPTKTLIDEQYPWMITIGNHVRITEGCKLITHDYSWSVLKTLQGGVYGASGDIRIGNNVFIGMNSIICRNVTIGDNVIIGAGSVVVDDCLENGVYAGVPAKKIADLSEFMEKRISLQKVEAKALALAYFERYGKRAPPEVFHEYFMLFSTNENLRDEYRKKLYLCDNYADSVNYLNNHTPCFDSFDEFMEYCYEGKK